MKLELKGITPPRLDRFDIRNVESSISRIGLGDTIGTYVNDLKCAPPRIMYGFPLIHTKHHSYGWLVALLNYIFETRLESGEMTEYEAEVCIGEVEKIHFANMEYEKEHPPRLPEPKKKSKGTRVTKALKEPKQPKIIEPKVLPNMVMKPAFILKNLKKKTDG